MLSQAELHPHSFLSDHIVILLIMFPHFPSTSVSALPAAGSQVDVATCTASAEQKNYPCDGAFDGKPADAEGTAWASHDNTTNAVLQVSQRRIIYLSIYVHSMPSPTYGRALLRFYLTRCAHDARR